MMTPCWISCGFYLTAGTYRGLEVALESFETDDLRIGENGDLLIRAHLGGKLIDIGPDVGTFNGMMQLSSHPAEFLLFLDQGGFKSLSGEIEGGVHTGDSSAHDQSPLVDGDDLAMERLQPYGTGDGHADQILGLFCGKFRIIGMDPGVLVPDIGHLEQISVQAACFQGLHEHRRMGFRTAGGDDHPVQFFLEDLVLDLGLGILAAGKEIVVGKDHSRQRLRHTPASREHRQHRQYWYRNCR